MHEDSILVFDMQANPQYIFSWAEALEVTIAVINTDSFIQWFFMTAWNIFLLAEAISMQAGLMKDCVSFAKSLECLVELMIPICSHQVTILGIGLSSSSRSNSGKGKTWTMAKRILQTHTKRRQKKNYLVA